MWRLAASGAADRCAASRSRVPAARATPSSIAESKGYDSLVGGDESRRIWVNLAEKEAEAR